MRNLFLVLFITLLLLGYGIKLYNQLKLQSIEDANFNTAIECVQDLENGKTEVCD